MQKKALYTVEHFKLPDAPPEPPPRWDRRKPPPPPSREKIKQVLREEAQRMSHQAKMIEAYKKDHWDSLRPAGLPNGELPYFELDWAADKEKTAVRTYLPESPLKADWAPHVHRCILPSERRAQREQRCAERAWDTRPGHPYAVLGEVPLLPDMVLPGPRPKPLTIRGDIWRPPSESNGEHDIRWLQPGVSLEGNVPRGSFRYFAIEARANSRLVIELKAYSGDPDLFVSQRQHRPDLENYTWRSNSIGDTEELAIEHDDPLIEHGETRGAWTCYIGVFGEKQSDYQITTRFVKV